MVKVCGLIPVSGSQPHACHKSIIILKVLASIWIIFVYHTSHVLVNWGLDCRL